MATFLISEAITLDNILVNAKIDGITSSDDRYAIVNLLISLGDVAAQWKKVVQTANDKFADTKDRDRYLSEEFQKPSTVESPAFSETTIRQLIDANVSILELGALAFLRQHLAK